MAAQKEVKIKVTAEGDLKGVQAMEDRIRQLQKQKIQLDIQANTSELENVKSRIETVKAELQNLKGQADVDDSKVKALESELESLEGKKLDLEIAVESGKLDAAKAEIEDLDGTTIDVDVNNISAMEAVDQIGQGFDRLKQGASEVGAAMGDVLESAGRMEQTETFLSMNLGADQAKKKLEEIRSVTDKLPGDDVTLQNLLSQAALKDASMTTDAFTQMGSAAADYMAAMQNFGKTSTETQQDLMNYILAGNTAEIERSPILQSHIDKLKEGNTVQERAKLLQEALTAEGWAGIASQDIYNNKMQQFNDMIERGKMNLGGMFLKGTEGAMDFIMKLDEALGGIVGMGLAAGEFAAPMVDMGAGLGQMAMGMKAIKDMGFIKWLKNLELTTKLAAAAEWLWNSSLLANPITWIVVAIIALAAALIWAYYNVDWFREMVDNAFASLQKLANYIWGAVTGALDWLAGLFEDFTNQLGLNTDDWGQAILGFLLFLPQLPMRVGQLLVDTLAKALGFGDNFCENMKQSATNAVDGFVNTIKEGLQGLFDYITTLGGLIPENVAITGNNVIDTILKVMGFILTLPAQIGMIFINIIAKALGFGDNFTQTMISSAVNSVTGFVRWIQTLPGRAGQFLTTLVNKARGMATEFVSNMVNGAMNAVNGFIQWIESLPGRLKEELDKMIQMAQDFAMEIANILTGGAAGMVVGWVTGSGEHSPGFMYDALIGELQAMANAPGQYLADLVSGISEKGYEMANALTQALFGVSLEDTINGILSPLTNLQETMQGVTDYIYSVGGLLPANVELTGNSIIDTILRVLAFVASIPVQVGTFLLNTIAEVLGFGPNFTQNLITAGMNAVNGFIQHVTTLPSRAGAQLTLVVNKARAMASEFVSSLVNGAVNAVNGFMNNVASLPSRFKGELDEMIGYAEDFVRNLPEVLKNAAINVVKSWIYGTGESSPGYMFDAFEGELKAMNDVSKSYDFGGTMKNTARRMVDAFGEPKLRLGTDEISRAVIVSGDGYDRSNTQNITFNFSDVVIDNEERMQRIVDYVERSMAFDNATAGRTV